MSEEQNGIRLSELLKVVGAGVQAAVPAPVWVEAEISEIKNHPSGHCYLTLVETDDNGRVKAKTPAVIWASTYRLLKPYFESETGQGLEVGMNILVRAQVQFSELYAFSLVISDINPSFTLGELELQRRRTITRLEEEGMMDMQQSLELPQLPRRFAVISAQTAAGYRDFMRHLHENEYGFKFETTLFPAVMQGKESPQSIVAAMDAVAQSAEAFDAVLILRGGGGAMDLVCFDDYDLAVNVAQFPLPVLTGIGHDHDYHIVDMVAYANVKTPTALADYLVDIFAQEDFRLESLASRLQLAVKGKATKDLALFDGLILRIRNAFERNVGDRVHALDKIELKLSAADPQKVLERGYSIVLKDGRKVISLGDVVPGDSLTLLLKDGVIRTKIESITPHE